MKAQKHVVRFPFGIHGQLLGLENVTSIGTCCRDSRITIASCWATVPLRGTDTRSNISAWMMYRNDGCLTGNIMKSSNILGSCILLLA